MIALIQHRRGHICIAERVDTGKLVTWKTLDGRMWLKSWVHVLEELDTLDEAKLVYPEYFV